MYVRVRVRVRLSLSPACDYEEIERLAQISPKHRAGARHQYPRPRSGEMTKRGERVRVGEVSGWAGAAASACGRALSDDIAMLSRCACGGVCVRGAVRLCVSPSLGQPFCKKSRSGEIERACGGQRENHAVCKQSRGQIEILLSSCVVPDQGSGPPPDRSVPSEDFFVVGAGFGRMGTSSLQMALSELGFGNTYHMKV